MELNGAVVVVTGASRGIGLACAELLTERGAVVVATGRDEAALKELTSRLGGSYVVADAADPDSAAEIVTHAVASHGRLDGLIVNAGVGYAGDVASMPPERIVELVDVNVRAPLLLARAAAAAMEAGSPVPADPAGSSGPAGPSRSAGSGPTRGIVFVSSIAGAVGVPGESVYSATKAAVEAFATMLREELRPNRISVSTVLPGVVATDFFDTRGAAYDRKFPRLMPATRVARVIVAALERGTPRRIVPRWLAIPARLATAAPGVYRGLARRFG